MKKIGLTGVIVSLLALFVACEDNWNDHYQNTGSSEGSVTDQKIGEWLASQPEFSEFSELMKETGMDLELNKDQVLTCWAVKDGDMTDIAGKTEVEKEQLAKHHINYVAIYSSKFEDGKLIKTLAGKNLYVTWDATAQEYLMDGHKLTGTQMCANGVVHVLEKNLEPRLNIYEYVSRLGDDYSMFRDSLLSFTERIFRPDLSFPLGVDEYGNTVYDSIFRDESIFSFLWDENTNYTLFVPDNAVYQATWQEIINLYSNVYNSSLYERDSLRIYNWIMSAVAMEGRITDYATAGNLESFLGEQEWRSDIQQVDQDRMMLMSNGVVHQLTYLHVPNYLLLQSLTSIPSIYKDVWDMAPEGSKQDSVDKYFTMVGLDLNEAEFNGTPAFGGFVGFWPDYNKENKSVNQFFYRNNQSSYGADKEFSLSWLSLVKDRFGNIIKGQLVPGQYRVYGSFRSASGHDLNLYVNDEFVAKFNAGNATYSWAVDSWGTNGYSAGYIGTYIHTGTTGPLTIKLENPVERNSTARRIVVQCIAFVPDDTNY
ncbi:MAG: fasciclin domain-containing protein [Culturomica sp.]|jgi:hypothetical protein|nr:fasciclin domain-containing protein [Culturomica sp.]